MPPFFYDLHVMSKKLKIDTPKFEVLIKKLKKRGFKTSRTHFCLTALKTDADYNSFYKSITC